MSRKHFSTLLVLTVIVAGIVLLLPGKTGRDALEESGLLFPDIGERINEVSRVVVTGAGQATLATLERGADRWTVQELGGYPADWEELRSLLAALAEARVVETKTDNPGYYDRLGVEDVAGAEATGVLLELTLGGEQFGLIVGNEPASRDGHYVRPAGAKTSLLIDRALDVPADLPDWVERQVADVGSFEVREVTVIHPGGETVRIFKEAATDSDFTLEGLPEGREVTSSWAVNSLANVLDGLRMESVAPDDANRGAETVRLTLLTWSGITYAADAWAEDDSHWLRLAAAAPAATGESSLIGDAGDNASGDAAEASPDATPEEAADAGENPAATVAEFNGRTTGWVFEITESKYVAMTKRLEDLLKPLAEGPGDNSP